MADGGSRSRSRSRCRVGENTERWFNLPSGTQLHSEHSAYLATSSRMNLGPTASNSPQIPVSVPTISTTPDINKSLPPPPEGEKRGQRQATFRSLLRGRSSSSQVDTTHLLPEPRSHHQRHLSAGAHLTVDIHGHYQQQYSRSMPNSPYGHSYGTGPSSPPTLHLGYSASSTASPETTQYEQHDVARQPQVRSSFYSAGFETSPPRARTFPDGEVLNATTRSSVSTRQRPHTWLSPTEPFADPSQFQLFVEATTGLPDDSDPWSPNGPNRLQSSLFARRPSNGSLPIPPQYIPAPIPDRTHQTASWQSFEPPLTPSRSVSAPMTNTVRQDAFQPYHSDLTPHMNAINAELEMLGLDGDRSSEDDELPDYAQSQAEMNAKKRAEATARARDLEARWRGARGSRS